MSDEDSLTLALTTLLDGTEHQPRQDVGDFGTHTTWLVGRERLDGHESKRLPIVVCQTNHDILSLDTTSGQ